MWGLKSIEEYWALWEFERGKCQFSRLKVSINSLSRHHRSIVYFYLVISRPSQNNGVLFFASPLRLMSAPRWRSTTVAIIRVMGLFAAAYKQLLFQCLCWRWWVMAVMSISRNIMNYSLLFDLRFGFANVSFLYHLSNTVRDKIERRIQSATRR